ncbi:hypothetical protein DID88_005534 [Monilinia fructigena]|uniref:Uncharacterized protein n=1 Tax=Monilinia fructigena TaxID=38457 RepID=A0A395J0D8_9HELO|nr:hypothetical protein DID88_005534 [Monilinia fructigena]
MANHPLLSGVPEQQVVAVMPRPISRVANHHLDFVVGAGYSHADILKFDNLSLSNTSRPRTPPSNPLHKNRNNTPPQRGPTTLSPPPRRSYTDFISHTNNDWAADDDEEEEDEYGYEDDDGDDFGLPSIF